MSEKVLRMGGGGVKCHGLDQMSNSLSHEANKRCENNNRLLTSVCQIDSSRDKHHLV